MLLEYGAGAAIKSEILINALQGPRMYAPIDIAADFLGQTIERFRDRFPDLPARPIIADFTSDFDIPAGIPTWPRAAFFSWEHTRNPLPSDPRALLRRMHEHVGPSGNPFIGVDLRKNVETLIASVKKMVGPAVKREGVAHLRATMGLSERRACSIVSADRKMVRYRSSRLM